MDRPLWAAAAFALGAEAGLASALAWGQSCSGRSAR
jgi:demethoxyubiquinone hydroxylase (CLK1/Coq7/Cat5 family)